MSFMWSVLSRAATLRQYNIARNIVTKGFNDDLGTAAQEIMLISKTRYVPIDTGALMESGRVIRIIRPGANVEYEMTYGGPPDYAVPVHEINKKYRHGREWKYLETPAKAYDYSGRLGPKMRKTLGSKLGGQTTKARAGGFSA